MSLLLIAVLRFFNVLLRIGESEQHIRDLFAAAKLVAPSFIFIDEIDTLCPKRENAGREMERRIVAQLGTCMDDLVR